MTTEPSASQQPASSRDQLGDANGAAGRVPQTQEEVDQKIGLFESKPERGVMADAVITLKLRSKLETPIIEMSELRRSLLFAELANVCYYDEPSAESSIGPLGFDVLEFFDRDGAQAYRFETAHDVVVACRGTEPHDINDVKADVDAVMAVVETVGRVHRGFNTETDDLWPRIEQTLMVDRVQDKPVWFCGHSLGGAMATICAGRCFMSDAVKNPEGLFTYGSPRVGDKQFINYVKDIEHVRWVNNNDVVPKLPPRWFGFRHHGREMYLDSDGRLKKLTALSRFGDGLRGFGRGLLRLKVDYFADHVIDNYIAAIAGVLEASEGSV